METTKPTNGGTGIAQKREVGWNRLLNVLFPRKCVSCGKILGSGALCELCLQNVSLLGSPLLCLPEGSALNSLAACLSYSGAGAVLMREFKFKRQTHCYDLVLREPFESCAKALYGGVCAAIVVPVPMYPAARRERGFNQAEYIARRLAQSLGLPYSGALLRKIKKNKVQHLLSAAARAQNVRGAYRATGGVAGKTLLLVDDITTTGFTLEECALALKDAGAARVLGIAVMYSMKK